MQARTQKRPLELGQKATEKARSRQEVQGTSKASGGISFLVY